MPPTSTLFFSYNGGQPLTVNVGEEVSLSPVITSGNTPYAYALYSGDMPPGFGLDTGGGNVSGAIGSYTPPGRYEFNIIGYSETITQSGNQGEGPGPPYEHSYSQCVAPITIILPGGVPTLACANPPDGVIGYAYSQPALTASSGAPPYSNYQVTGGSMPPGISLDRSSGYAFGTGTTEGTYNFTATVTDASGATSAPVSCSITINASGSPPTSVSPPETSPSSSSPPVYPFNIIAMPAYPAPQSIEWSAMDVVGVSRSPFSGQVQTQDWMSAWLEAGIQMPPLTDPNARAWEAFLLALRGPKNAFLFGDPLKRFPLGTGAGNPVVNGSGQSGFSLATSGWVGANALLPGDFLQIGLRLYRNLGVVNDGAQTLSIWPNIRESPNDQDPIILFNTVGLFRLKGTMRKWSEPTTRYVGMQFDVMEAL